MKFLVDLPLGGLAKWLRFCGFDAENRRLGAELPPPVPDTYILTRQESFKRLARPDLVLVNAAAPEAQLQEVLFHCKISPRQIQPLSRCSRCNEPLSPVPREQVQGRVPEHVFHHHDQFFECPRCRRVFWPGSHLPAIIRTLQASLNE
ncbi:MAG: hypothetical protein NTW80_14045 [Deltaproteobacteria bacterium]|nr:hypothetical protein [Deltaproteobacteria bacterium]